MKISSSPLDILLITLLKDTIYSIGPSLFALINSSLVSSCVPSYFKQAVVQPLLKKPILDPSLPSNYQPISKLPLLSKPIQLTAALSKHNIFDTFQSGVGQSHSTETALLRVSNDLMMSSEAGNCSILVLLDLSAAFDTVDHCILLERLREWAGVSGSALNWFASYLSGRNFSVSVGPYISESAPLSCGVPQGSVLGPILFTLYLLPLGHIIRKFSSISYHCYTDNIQICFSFNPDRNNNFSEFHNCLAAIKDWMATNFLQLNTDKTE